MGHRAHGGEDDVLGSWMGRRLTGSRIPTGVVYGGQGRGVVQQSMGGGASVVQVVWLISSGIRQPSK